MVIKILVTLFISSQIFWPLMAKEIPNEITVKFFELKKSINCSKTTDVMFLCKDNDKTILLKYGAYNFEAFGFDSNQSSVSYSIESAYKDKTLLLGSNINTRSKKASNLSMEHWNKVGAIKSFFNLEESKQLTKGPAEYEALVKKHIESMNKHKGEIDSIYNENNYSVTLSNGMTAKCQREQSRSLSEAEKKSYSLIDLGLACGSFKCDPLKLNGNQYNGTLIFSSNPHSTSPASLYLTKKDSFGPKVVIKKITSNNSKFPLIDYTNYLDEMESLEEDQSLIDSLPAQLKELRQQIIHHKDFDRSTPINHFNKICETNSPGFNLVKTAREKLFEKLANVEVSQLIKVLADGSLVSEFTDPSKAIASGCFYEGVYLDSEAAKNLARLKENIFPKVTMNESITLEKANELFNKALKMDDIAWKYNSDGCYARAHLVAKRLKAEGYKVDKVWLKGDLYVPETDTSWNFHVAPIVYVKVGHEIKKMVIDPTLFKGPVTVEEWDKKITKRTVRGSIVTAFPFPENASSVERAALAFSSASPYIPGDSISLSEEAKDKMALETMKLYKNTEIELGL